MSKVAWQVRVREPEQGAVMEQELVRLQLQVKASSQALKCVDNLDSSGRPARVLAVSQLTLALPRMVEVHADSVASRDATGAVDAA